ncbi:hypothetical protein HZS_6175 [Henneguya salminicola]|nr:hypothetical protein HZS_6175 [Henneguya salminicola]
MHTYFVNRKTLETNCIYESALNFLNDAISREITIKLIIDIDRGNSANENRYGNSRKQIEWILDVMSYGLSLSLTDIDIIEIATSKYVGWINSYANSIKGNPSLIYDDWEHFFPLILLQLKNLFIPRTGDKINKHASLCSTVLISIRNLTLNIKLIPKLYDEILFFLLSICSKVFFQQPSSGIQHLGEKLGGILSCNFFYIWVTISLRNFPTLSVWNSFDDVSSHCVHNEQFVVQWASVCLILTKKILKIYALVDCDSFVRFYQCKIMEECLEGSNSETLFYVWLKIFYACGNLSILSEPMEICRLIWPDTVAHELMITRVSEPTFHGTNNYSEFFLLLFNYINLVLPGSFFNYMRFLSVLSQLLIPDLRISEINFLEWYYSTEPSSKKTIFSSLNRLKTSISSSVVEKNDNIQLDLYEHFSQTLSILEDIKYWTVDKEPILFSNLHPYEPKHQFIECNTVLNLIYEWLLSSCLSFKDTKISENIDYIIHRNYDLSNPTVTDPEFKLNLNDSFEVGRAYAFNIMIRLITHQPDNARIEASYKSRFFILLSVGLLYHQHKAGRIFSSIILSSIPIFSCNLEHVHILIPHYLRAINTVLVQTTTLSGPSIESSVVQNAALRILNSIISQALDISDTQPRDISQFSEVNNTYETVANYIIDILCSGIAKETLSSNIHLYLSSMTIMLYDLIYRYPSIYFSSQRPAHAPGDNKFKHDSPRTSTTHSLIPLIDKFFMNVSKQARSCLGSIINLKKLDVVLTLAFIEFVGALAIIPMQYISEKECIILIVFMCDYIEELSKRPPQQHLRDVHSNIVSAYTCIIIWIRKHNCIVSNEMCMENILQVIELGLSGNKSDNNSDSLKEYKTQKPISGRVCDIAEYLMFVILEHWPSIHLDNKFLPSTIVEQDIDNLNCTYFILDNKAIISCINISNKDKVPSCLVFIRGIMGKHVYQFELKSTLNSDSFDNQNNERKLMNMEEFALETIILKNPNTFETVSNIWKPCQADNSILTFSKYMLNKENELSFLLEQYDAELSNETKSIELYKKTLINSREHALRNVSSPIFKGSYDTYRMLLNNLMMIRMDVEKVNNLEFPYNFCKVPTTQEFIFDLACYDCISIRNTEFAYLFVVNCFNNSVEDILSHEDSLNTNLYNEFIRDLGEEVVVKSHNGYLGPFNKKEHENISFIYYSDLINELIVIPSYAVYKKIPPVKKLSLIDEKLNETDFVKKTSSVDVSSVSSDKKNSFQNIASKISGRGTEIGVVLFWIEDPHNTLLFPLKELVNSMNESLQTNDFHPHVAILIYPLNHDQVKIRTIHFTLLFPLEIAPIHDGIVVKKSYLGKYIRDCMISIILKRRLEIDVYDKIYLNNFRYNSPHIKRKMFIQNLSKKYSVESFPSTYYSDLFNCN